MPPDSATLSSAVHVKRAMPPHQITYCRFAPLGPNPERNPDMYVYIYICVYVLYVYMYICICMYIYVYLFIYILTMPSLCHMPLVAALIICQLIALKNVKFVFKDLISICL